MAKKKKKSNNKQGVVSWLVNGIFLMVGLSPLFSRAAEAIGSTDAWGTFTEGVVQDYTGYSMAGGNFDATRLIRGYGPPVGAIVGKTALTELTKRCKVKSLIPSFS